MLDGITVTGDDPAVTPKVTIAAPPVNVKATTVRTLKEGTGDESVAGNKVTVRQALFLGKDGKQLQSDFETKSTASFILQGTDTIPGPHHRADRRQGRLAGPVRHPAGRGVRQRGQRRPPGIAATDDLVVVADVVVRRQGR